jgi:hypothetical protein
MLHVIIRRVGKIIRRIPFVHAVLYVRRVRVVADVPKIQVFSTTSVPPFRSSSLWTVNDGFSGGPTHKFIGNCRLFVRACDTVLRT